MAGPRLATTRRILLPLGCAICAAAPLGAGAAPGEQPSSAPRGATWTQLIGSSGGTGSPPAGSTPRSGGGRRTIKGVPGERGGFFVIRCDYARTARVDPIIAFGRRASHLHEFFGATGVTATSTARGLRHHATSCVNRHDTAAYWSPVVSDRGRVVSALYQNEYWFDGGFSRTESIPFGFEMIAGDMMATHSQSTRYVFYYCGAGRVTSSPMKPRPYDCAGRSQDGIIAVIVFPQCWDGVRAAGMMQMAHMAYPIAPGTCPAGFNHVFPRLEEHVHLGIASPAADFRLSSGPYYTLHGDFVNSWHMHEFQRFIRACINAHRACTSFPR